MKTILFTIFLFLSLISGFMVTDQAGAERDVVVTPAPPRTQTARTVEVRPVTAQPAPVAAKPIPSPAAPAVVKVPQTPIAPAQPEKKVTPVSTQPPKPVTAEKKGTGSSQSSPGFFQGLLDRWFPKR